MLLKLIRSSYRIKISKSIHQKYSRFLSADSATSKPIPTSSESPETPESKSFFEQSTADTKTYVTDSLEPVPIKSLNIVQRIETFEKPGSIFKNLFVGIMDKDLLSFPFLLKSRQEFLDLNEQYEMVRKTWNRIKKDDDTLTLLKYNSLHELSVSEMMHIFEAMGASIQKNLPFGIKENEENRFEKRLSKTFQAELLKDPKDVGETALKSFHDIREAILAFIPVIERNSIVNYAIKRSPNANIKKLLEQNSKIAFAFDEESPERTDFHINKWSTEAKISNDFKSWMVQGEKNRIIQQDYSHYLVFHKVTKFPDVKPMKLTDNDVGIVGLLLPSDQVTIEYDGLDYFAIPYQKIKYSDLEIDRDSCEVVNATKDLSDFNNIKGCGQLAVSAIILGLLKQLQKNTYAHLVNNRLALTNCELVQFKLYRSTCKIYALESMIYLTAAMFDSFEKGNDLGCESMAAKILAVDYAYEIIDDLRSLFGSRYPFSSIVYDLIYYLDSFLDSSLNNRLYMGQQAINHFKVFEEEGVNRVRFFEKFPIYSIKHYLRQRKLRKYEVILTREMTKYIHHNMHAACDWIEHSIHLLRFSTYYLTKFHKEQINERWFDLNRITQHAMEIHLMISSLSRANHSLCYGFRNNNTEKEICMAICKEMFLKHLQLFEEIDKRTFVDNDPYARNIFEINLEEKGYFPKLFQIN